MKIFIITVLFLSGMSTVYAQKDKKMNSTIRLKNASVIEYVTFKAKEDIPSEEMLAAAKNTDAVLANIDGFIHRIISWQENNTWIEVVFWETKEHAEKGLHLFLEDDKSKDFLSKIQEGSVKIEYSLIQ